MRVCKANLHNASCRQSSLQSMSSLQMGGVPPLLGAKYRYTAASGLLRYFGLAEPASKATILNCVGFGWHKELRRGHAVALRFSARPLRLGKRRTICMAPEKADVIIKVELSRHNIGLQQCQRNSLACLPFCSLRSMSKYINPMTVLSAAGRSR